MTKISDILIRVERRLSHLAGIGAQVYAEDTLLEYIQMAFNSLFEEYDWEEYKGYIETTLDGTLGVGVHDFSTAPALKTFADIKAVRFDKNSDPLRSPPDYVVPSHVTGNVPRYIVPYLADSSKIFRVIPYTATGTIHVWYKSRPYIGLAPIDMDVYVDEDLLVAMATLDYLVSDGTNPGATERQREVAKLREQEVRRNMSPILTTELTHTAPLDYWTYAAPGP